MRSRKEYRYVAVVKSNSLDVLTRAGVHVEVDDPRDADEHLLRAYDASLNRVVHVRSDDVTLGSTELRELQGGILRRHEAQRLLR